MKPKRTTLIASASSLVLGMALAVPVLGVAPTYSGVLYCDRSIDGQRDPVATVSGATRQGIATVRKDNTVGSGFCANGTFDTSQLTKDA